MEHKKNVNLTESREVSDMQSAKDKKPSPFAWHEGASFEFEKFKQKKTEKLVSLFEKRLLDKDGAEILSYFNKYVYLNSHLIWLLFSDTHEEFEETYVKNRISGLYKLGLLTRFRIAYADSRKVVHSSPFVYCLSDRGSAFFSKGKETVPSVESITRRLAFNQYYITASHVYKYRLLANEYDFSEEGRAPDGYVSFVSEKQELCFQILSVRTDPMANHRLASAFDMFSKEPTAAFIILAESELVALEMERFRKNIEAYKGFSVLYLCDTHTFNPCRKNTHVSDTCTDDTHTEDTYDMFSNLLLVNDEECRSYSTVIIPVDEL